MKRRTKRNAVARALMEGFDASAESLRFALATADMAIAAADQWDRSDQADSLGVAHPDDLHGLGPCAACGHDPACGWSQIGEDWLCHADDHSCYQLVQPFDVRLPDPHPCFPSAEEVSDAGR